MRSNKVPPDPKRLLIILHGSLGDVTRAMPLATLIRRGLPGTFIAWAVEPRALPLIERHPALDDVIVFNRAGGWRDFFPFLEKIRSGNFNVVLDLQRHFKSGLIGFFSGASYRIGFAPSDCKEFNWIFNNAYIPPMGESIQKLDHYLKFAEYLGLETEPIEWSFKLSEAEEMQVERRLAPVGRYYAALFVGSRWESKLWFPEQIAECSRMIQERYGLDVVLLGSRQDEMVAAEAQARWNRRVTNVVGQTSLRESVGIIARARVSIGPDTGLMHIAAAVGTPVVSLWGATNPSRSGPYRFEHLVIQGTAPCSPCYLKHCPIGRTCMRSITTEEIAEKVALALAGDYSNDQRYGSQL